MPDPPVDATQAVSEPVRTFVTGATRTALAAPSASVGNEPADVGLPTVVVVETGEGAEGPPAAAQPAAQPAASAGSAAAGRPVPQARMSLAVQLGDRQVVLRPTEEAMWGYVSLAFKIGGFAQVVSARQAIDAAVAHFEEYAAQAKATADEAAQARDEEEQRISAEPAGLGRETEAWRLRDQASDAARKGRETRANAASVQWFKSAFNDVWAQLAVIEEAWLREWEIVAFPELLRILDAHMARADQQWTRYGCYLADKPDTAAKISESQGKTASLRLNLKRERDASAPSGSQTLPTLRDLWTRANDLRNYAKTTIPEAIKHAEETADRGEQSAAQRLAAHVEDLAKDWTRQLADAETEDPVLLQIYRDVTYQTTLDELETMIINALLDAYYLSKDVLDHAIRLLRPGTTRRITPRPTTDPKQPGGLTDDERAVVASSGQADALALGLVIPASVVLGVQLEQPETAKYSAWLHQPVRMATDARLQKLPQRAALVELGTLAYAAKTHAFDEFESLRQHDKERFGRWSLVVLGVGLVLTPFTGGGSMVAAGLVAATFQIAAFMEEAVRVETASALSRSTLNALEMTMWTRPSQVALVRLALSTAIDVGQTILAGEIPLVIDLLVMAVSWGIRPEEQEPGKRSAPAGLPAPGGGG